VEEPTRKEAVIKGLELAGFEASEVFGRLGQARNFINQQPIFYDNNKLWWLWNIEKKCWEITDEVDILNHITERLNLDVISSKARTEIVNSLKQIGRLNVPKPVKSNWIQFEDMIVDVVSGEEFQATPEYFIVNPIPYKLHKERYEGTPVMDKLFKEWVGEEYVKTLYEIIAYCLIPDYPIHRMFCFIGGGMNGKSCFLNLLKKFIGENNVCSTELDTLITSRFEITRLHKKLCCLLGETNFTEMSKTSILKKLTGGDTIGYEYKNKDLFHEVNYAKILIATNNLPTTNDKTIGFYRRWMIIDFPNQFSEQIDILKTIPEEEYESLAAKSVYILRKLLKERKFTNEGEIMDRMKRYETRSDFLQHFLKENIEEDTNAYISKKDFYTKFIAWCKENRHREMAENTLGKKMKEKGIEAGKKYMDWLFDGKGGQLKIWLGVKWKD
jgi:putative DNA primase/helicase|tara:strand:+ start:702 stop:2027 length:1326 start_codon:yes stop_codon:yes gene_type:complete